jgi:hypothetical protein
MGIHWMVHWWGLVHASDWLVKVELCFDEVYCIIHITNAYTKNINYHVQSMEIQMLYSL